MAEQTSRRAPGTTEHDVPLFDFPEAQDKPARLIERPSPDSPFYYDLTPGHTPSARKVPPVGELVDVAPTGYIGTPMWRGRITKHMYRSADDSYTGLSVAECVDSGDFPSYQVVGRGYQVEAIHLRPVEEADQSRRTPGTTTRQMMTPPDICLHCHTRIRPLLGGTWTHALTRTIHCRAGEPVEVTCWVCKGHLRAGTPGQDGGVSEGEQRG